MHKPNRRNRQSQRTQISQRSQPFVFFCVLCGEKMIRKVLRMEGDNVARDKRQGEWAER